MNQFPADHPAMADHFPGKPIVPGALLLQRVLRAATGAGFPVNGVIHAKFLRPLQPDTAFDISFEPLDPSRVGFRVDAAAGPIARGELQLDATGTAPA